MKNIVLLFIFLSYFSVFAQKEVFEIPLNENGEISNTYLHFKKIINDIPLDTLETSKNNFHFRYLTPRHITEIWKNGDGKIEGALISFAEKQPDSMDLGYGNNRKPKTYFVTSKKLKRRTTKAIYKKLVEVQMDTMTSKTLPRPNKNISGILMEFASIDSYKFKEFWISNVIGEHDLNDKLIAEFALLIRTKMNYERAYKRLKRDLPKGCFNMANGFVTCK